MNRLKNPSWREADQLAIYKHDRGVEPGSTKKKLELSGQSGPWNRDLQISRPAPWPFGHNVYYYEPEERLRIL